MMIRTIWILAITGCIGLGASLCHAQSDAAMGSSPAASCEALRTENFSTIQDAPTQITETKMVQPEAGTPAYCLVTGYISPNVGIEIGLPTPWNGRFIETGCAGTCGVL